MTRKQAKQWLPEITHWTNGGNLWNYEFGRWQKMEAPAFRTKMYIIEDEHFEARKAYALGEPIEWSDKHTSWTLVENPTWKRIQYRPRPKKWYNNIPEEGIICWVWNGDLRDRQSAEVIEHKDGKFMTNLPYWWNNAIPIKPEECYQGDIS